MKLRISGNSIRVRLKQLEVARLAQGLPVEQTTFFSECSALISTITPSTTAKIPTVTFVDSRIAISLPRNEFAVWANSAQVSIETLQRTGDNRVIKILVEKDFECLHESGSDEVDSYPNPRK